MPHISIIVPIYNIEDYLEPCLASIAAQTYDDFEVLCVIDGATDGSFAIAREFEGKDARFKTLVKENGGLSSARNFGLGFARGEIIMFVDGDDELTPDACETIARSFEDTGADGLIFGAEVVPAENSTPWFDCTLQPETRRWKSFSPDLMFAPYATPFVWRNAVRRSALAASGVLFDEEVPFGEDVVFQFQLYPRMGSIATLDKKLYRYRLQRTGSLMDGHRETRQRLIAHRQIVEAVCRDWESQGLIERYGRRLFQWTIPYLTRDIQELPPDQLLEIMEAADGLWHRYFGDCALEPAKLNRRCLCRGEGKVYGLYRISTAAPFARLQCEAQVDGRPLPVNAYPLHPDAVPFCNDWVLEFPSLPAGRAQVLCSPGGLEGAATSFSLDFGRAALASKLNAVLRHRRCSTIRGFEQPLVFHRYQCRVLQRFEADDCLLWRTEVRWTGPGGDRPSLLLADWNGNPIACEPYFCEFQEGDEGKNRPHTLILTVPTPPDCNGFILEAQPPDGSPLAAGFTSVNPVEAAAMEAATADLMKSAADDTAAYRRWLGRHRAQPSALRAQRSACSRQPHTVPISLFLWAVDASPLALEETVASLKRQSYPHWTLTIAGGECAPGGNDGRIVTADPGTMAPPRWLQNAAASALKGLVGFLQPGDRLEPDALACFARAAQGHDPAELGVWYCEEDIITATGPACPVFKSPLNVDALYSYNWVGQLALFSRNLLAKAPVTAASDFASWLYEQTLFAYGAKARFTYIPRLLFHGTKAAAPYRIAADEAADAAARGALERHLVQRKLDATVEEGPRPGTWRLRYGLPDPHPLVSIIIPNRDRLDLLEPCLRSILEKATYDAFEVIVVENNSSDVDTFVFYEAIAEEDPRVRVIHWPYEFNYAKIVNFGARHAQGDYLLLLNNDTAVIEPSFIEEMLGPLQRREVGVVGAKLLFRDGLVQHAGAAVGVWDAVVHVNQFFTPERGGYLAKAALPGQFTAVTGACQMVSADLFRQLGGYDEAFAVGFNDIDFCLRARKAGKLVAFTPYALLHHYEFSSRGREEGDPQKMERWKREQALFKERWPEPFQKGDPYTSPNLMRDNTYYRLG